MANNHALLALCYQLADKGIKPSVAMLRAKASGKVPLQTAISVIQDFQQGVKPTPMGASAEVDSTKAERSLEDRVVELEQQVKLLTERLERLQESR